ncbi:membrane protein insertion efficiency factor YidD [Georgenia sp. AZ-5]|uniref:membrane protein insertion efficiency factor YidD n=1 Tax=Georgenia sp. AZ-5 TaxID=3367526 RepID=UPI00375469D4
MTAETGSERGGRTGGAGDGLTEPPEPAPRNPLTWVMLAVVRAYQAVVSPWLPPSCKYYPSCSAYAVTALRRHGFVKGSLLAAWRLLRCNPWSLGGVDHVPLRGSWSSRKPVRSGAAPGSPGESSQPRTLWEDTRGARSGAPDDR